MRRVALAAAAMAAALGLSMSGAVSAGPVELPDVPEAESYSVVIYYWVDDADGNSLPIPAGLAGEFYAADGTNRTAWCTTVPTTTATIGLGMTCGVTGEFVGEDYTIGLTGLPDGFYVQNVSCDPNLGEMLSDFPGAAITVDSDYYCSVEIYEMPTLWIDKIFQDGDEGGMASDFTIEVYDDAGVLVTTAVDPSDTWCSVVAPDPAECAAIQLPPGTYVLGEESVTGYEATWVNCQNLRDQNRSEMFSTELGEFEHLYLTDTYCQVENNYYTQIAAADIVVVNDSGGTATGDDFTIEVYDSDGVLVGSAVDPEPGVGNASANWSLPIGNYTFGLSGPPGYEASVVVSYVDVLVEMLADPSAGFVLEPFRNADAVITVNDPTTTTTTTTSTTTTVPPTTIATTTTSIQGILPATGNSGPSGMLALLALGMLVLGAGAVFATRRT